MFRFSANKWIDELIKIFLSVIFLCLLCPLKFNIQGDIPITLQSLAVILVACCLGWRIGAISILIYLLLGVTGVPVFAGYSSGWEIMTGQFGGFLISFLIAGFVVGYFSEKEKIQKPIFILSFWIVGHLIILLVGGLWLSQFSTEWWSMIKTTLPGAAIKIIVGSLLTLLLVQLISRRKLS
ncbi:MAG: biotin transporter BioY [Bacteroidota bacterium]